MVTSTKSEIGSIIKGGNGSLMFHIYEDGFFYILVCYENL